MDETTRRTAERILGRPPRDAAEAEQAGQYADLLAQEEYGLGVQGRWCRWMRKHAPHHGDLSWNRSPVPVNRVGWGVHDVSFYRSRRAWPLRVRKACMWAARYARFDDVERWLMSRQREEPFWVAFLDADKADARALWRVARRLGWEVTHREIHDRVAIQFVDARDVLGKVPGRREGRVGEVVEKG